MLNKLLKIIVVLISLSISLKGQIADDYKNEILQKLADPKKSWTVLGLVLKFEIYDAIPILESKIWENKVYMQLRFLNALAYLESPNAHNLALAFVDSVDHYDELKMGDETKLGVKAYVNHALFMVNDFSKADYVMQQLRAKPTDIKALSLLPKLVKYLTQYTDEAKNILLNATVNSEWDDYRFKFEAVEYLEEIFGAEMIPLYLKFFKNIEESSDSLGMSDYTRIVSFEFLCKYNFSNLKNLIKEQLYIEPGSSYKIDFIDTLLSRFGTPENVAFIRNYLNWESDPDSIIKSYVNDLSLEDFIPKRFSNNLLINSVIDSLIVTTNKCKLYQWIDENLKNNLIGYLDNAKNILAVGDSINCAKQIKSFQQKVDFELNDSLNTTPNFVTEDAWKFLYYYSQYILDRLPAIPKGIPIALKNSTGNLLPGGLLQYYAGSWKDAVNNNDGTFTIDPPEGEASTTLKTISLRMTYEYGTQTKNNITVGTDTIVFQTVNAQVQLQNSQGVLIDSGSVQYYAGTWRNFGSTVNGIASKELLPLNYSFRMNYAYASKDKQQDLGTNPNVVFQTVAANVQLQSSAGNFIDVGSVQYYSGAWRTFGITTNGVAVKELLPNNYSFRMTYAFASKDKQQDLNLDTIIVFKTVAATVQLKNSSGGFIDEGTVQYYSGAWRNFGSTTDGVAVKELLPNSYSFRMTYAYASKDKQQDLNASPVVIFQTVAANVQLQNSTGSLMPAPMGDEGIVQYYSGAWRAFGPTSNGVAVKELLPNNYTFKMNYAYASKDKQQDIGANNTVVFQTVSANVILQNSSGNLMPDPLGNQGTVQYYSGAWRAFGTTTNGIATKELLPNNYSFRMTYAFASKDKQQDLGTNPNVVFQTVAANVQLQNSAGILIDQGAVQYYSGAWRDFGTTTNGVVIKELLPNSYSFRMTYEYVSNDKTQDIGANSVVVFPTVLCTIRVKDSQNQPVNDVLASYYSGAWRQIGDTVNGEITKELLPANLSFRIQKQDVQQNMTQNIGTNNLVEFTLP